MSGGEMVMPSSTVREKVRLVRALTAGAVTVVSAAVASLMLARGPAAVCVQA